MADLELRPVTTDLVIDARMVESYVRDAKLAVIDATAYVVVIGVFAAVRILGEVPFQRASVGIYLAVALASISLKRWLLGGGAALLVTSAVAGFAAGLPILFFLVGRNRGTLFAEAVALLVTLAVVHVVDRAAVARG